MPDLNFTVESAEVLEYAAVPTLLFRMAVENTTGEEINSVALHTQIRIAATRRSYDAEEQQGLWELFGAPHQWGGTLRSLVWMHTNVAVPRFSGGTTFGMPVTCTYDPEVVGTKYFRALESGEVPLEFLFSGQIFYRGEGGALQIVQIPWEKEAEFRLPIGLWQDMIEQHFPNTAWLRIRRDTFDLLQDYKSRKGLLTWEGTLEDLLQASEEEVGR
jgi:hypothetical protein